MLNVIRVDICIIVDTSFIPGVRFRLSSCLIRGCHDGSGMNKAQDKRH